MEDLFAQEFDLEQMEAETEAMLALNYLDRDNSIFRRTEGGLRSRPVPGGCCIAGYAGQAL